MCYDMYRKNVGMIVETRTNLMCLQFAETKDASLWFCRLSCILSISGAVSKLDARITVLMGVSAVADTVCSFLSPPTCFHEAKHKRCEERHRDTKSIEWRQPEAPGAGEWVAGGLAPGTSNEESLPACLSIWPHQLIWCLPDWQTGGANGHLGPHTHTHREDGDLLNRCDCACLCESGNVYILRGVNI